MASGRAAVNQTKPRLSSIWRSCGLRRLPRKYSTISGLFWSIFNLVSLLANISVNHTVPFEDRVNPCGTDFSGGTAISCTFPVFVFRDPSLLKNCLTQNMPPWVYHSLSPSTARACGLPGPTGYSVISPVFGFSRPTLLV